MARIGYAKLGRVLKFDEGKYGFQGDAESPNLLRRLALRNPGHEFVLIGKNSNFHLGNMPSNVTNPWPDDAPRAPWSEGAKGMCESCGQEHAGLRLASRYAAEVEEYVIQLGAQLDGMIIQVGQHGVSHHPLPPADTTWEAIDSGRERLTKPYTWARNYGSSTVRAINAMGDRTDGKAPVIWIVTDPRNYLKARDVKWPTGEEDVLAQYAYQRTAKHERYRDTRTPQELGFENFVKTMRHDEVWQSTVTYRYGGLELMILADNWQTWGQAGWEDRLPVGVASTSFAKGITTVKEKRRSQLIMEYVLTPFPDAEVFGKWDEVSLKDVPPDTVQRNNPAIFPELLNRWRVTLSLPALGSSWTVAKPYQCWAANVACFMLGRLDDHGFVLPTRRRVRGVPQVAEGLYSIRNDWTDEEIKLARWVRIEEPHEFEKRALTIAQSQDLWQNIVNVQRQLLTRRWDEAMTETKIEKRLGLRDE